MHPIIALLVALAVPMAVAQGRLPEVGESATGPAAQPMDGRYTPAPPALTATPPMLDSATPAPGDTHLSRLLGMPVSTPDDRPAGILRDLVVDMNTGRILRVVLGIGGMAGAGERTLALPPSAFVGGGSQRSSEPALRVDAGALERARAPQPGDGLGRRGGGIEPERTARFARGSALLGAEVKHMSGDDIGEVRDVAVDLSGGRVNKVWVTFEPMFAPGDVAYAFGLARFDAVRGSDELLLDVEADQLPATPSMPLARL